MKKTTELIQTHPFHLVNYSYWPFLGSISAFVFTTGIAMYMHDYKYGFLYLSIGLIGVFSVMIIWWRDVINEGLAGFHSQQVQVGLRYGMILFIVTEVMVFFAFFWGFFHSSLSPTIELGCVWPPKGIYILHPFQIPLLNTLLLLLSGVAVTWSHHAIIAKDYNPGLVESANGLLVTVILAAIFTLFQVFEYLESSFTISDSVYGTTFYMLTGLHGFHVLIGSIFLLVCYFRMIYGQFLFNHHVGFEAAIWYWHFVDIVWLFLYLFVYCWSGLGEPAISTQL
jgi:cytochrome c oxidase subunit 3